MGFDLSHEHAALQATARQFVDGECPPRQAMEWDEENAYPAELFKAMADIGWFGLAFPEEAGGDGGGAMELALIAQQLRPGSLHVAKCFIRTPIPRLTGYRWGNDEQRRHITDKMFTGESRLAVAISEPDTGSDAAALRCAAVDMGDHFVVNGQKMWCTGAGLPGTTMMTYVRTKKGDRKHDGISLLLIPADAPGVELRQAPTLARHILGTYEVFLTDVIVPKTALVGQQEEAWKVMLSNLELERVLMSGGYVGV